MCAKARPVRWRYGHGVIRPTAAGTFSVFVPLGHGQRRRKVCKTMAEARAWIDAEHPDRISCRFAPDASAALSILPDGVTLLDAARFWVDSHPASASATLGDAWARYEAAHAVALASKTLGGYRTTFAAFASSLGGMDRPLSAATRSAAERFVEGKTPQSRNGALRALSAIFGLLVRQGLLSGNPCDGISHARVRAGVPSILTPAQGRTLLSFSAEHFPAVASCFATGMFAGIRPQELMRLRPSNLVNDYLVLGSDITKTADTRAVEVQPNLAAWLAKFPIPARGWSARALKLAKKAAPVKIPQDALRHSFATYAYEMCKDAARVSAEMGHQGTAVFFRHYRALCAPGDGAKWFSIMP